MEIRPITRTDKPEVLAMMRTFYRSDAVFTNGSEEIFDRDIEACLRDNPFLEGYVIADPSGIHGYAMLAKSYSTEFGKPCVWIEDLYLEEAYRGCGAGREFLSYVAQRYPDAVIRLEVEDENTHAVHVYENSGFQRLPYLEMIRLEDGIEQGRE